MGLKLLAFIFFLGAGGLYGETILENFLDTVVWDGQNSLHMSLGGKEIAIDPLKADPQDVPDVVLLTHIHQDHFQPGVLKELARPGTVFYAPADVAQELKKILPQAKILTVRPGQSFKEGNLTLQTVPAYNLVKTQDHPKSKNWVGYLLSDGKITVYDTGDTERIPEMAQVKADIIFLPLGQTYTMNSVEEAAAVVADVKAQVAVPVHFGLYEGTQADAQKFAQLVKVRGVEVYFLPQDEN